MLGNDRIETASTAVTSIRRRNDTEKSTWRTHVEIAALNRWHNFNVDSLFKIDEIWTNFPRGISTSNGDRWRIDEDVSIGLGPKIWDILTVEIKQTEYLLELRSLLVFLLGIRIPNVVLAVFGKYICKL